MVLPQPEIAISFPPACEQNYTSDQLDSRWRIRSSRCLSGRMPSSTSRIRVTTTPQIPLGNLLSLYPQFDGSFHGLPLLAAISRYDSMQLRFEKRSGKYFTIQGSYTLARATDNSSVGREQLGGMARTRRPAGAGPAVLTNTDSAPTTQRIVWRRRSRATYRWPRSAAGQQHEQGRGRGDRRLVGFVECHTAKRTTSHIEMALESPGQWRAAAQCYLFEPEARESALTMQRPPF